MLRFAWKVIIPDPGMPEIAIRRRSELGISCNLSFKDRNHRESDPEISEESFQSLLTPGLPHQA